MEQDSAINADNLVGMFEDTLEFIVSQGEAAKKQLLLYRSLKKTSVDASKIKPSVGESCPVLETPSKFDQHSIGHLSATPPGTGKFVPGPLKFNDFTPQPKPVQLVSSDSDDAISSRCHKRRKEGENGRMEPPSIRVSGKVTKGKGIARTRVKHCDRKAKKVVDRVLYEEQCVRSVLLYCNDLTLDAWFV